MRYLVVDGMVSGTGVRDRYARGYVELAALGLSFELAGQVGAWLAQYREAHYEGFDDEEAIAALDAQGMALTRLLQSELPSAKLQYFSAARTRLLTL